MFTSLALAWMTIPAQATEGRSKGHELAAIHTQEQSIQKLLKFLKSHPGDSREPDFLVRLADLYFEKSGISFQYTEGESVKNSKKFYTDSLQKAAIALSDVIRKYPSHVSVPDAYFKRGKAYKELKKTDLSRADYLKLASLYPNYHRLDSAWMDLADYAQDSNHHDEALKYLLQIEKNESSQYYTMALHKAGWSHFNLGNFSPAIQYLKKEILTYQSRKSELPYLESAYQDLALFYFEALNKKAAFAHVPDALELFETLSENQVDTQNRPFLGLILMRFSKLLKAYQLSSELDQLKALLLKKYDQLPETMEIAMLIYEYHFDRHEYGKLISLLSDADIVRKKVNQPALNRKYEAAISRSLSQLHEYVMKNKQSTELDQLLKPMTELTDFLQAHLTVQNPTTVLALYSMAETSFTIHRYPTATHYYTSLLQPEVVLPAQLSKETLLLRVISSRFQELKAMNLIQEKLSIAKTDAPLSELKKEERLSVREWLTWVFDPLALKNIDAFTFQLEAFKLKYRFIDRAEAMKGLEDFALLNSASEEAGVAAAIVLDTNVQSQLWNNVYEISKKMLSKKNWKDRKFPDQLQDLNSDAHLKITLASQDPNEVLVRTQECVKNFKNQKILLQCKLLLAKTRMSLKQLPEAEETLSDLSKGSLKEDDLKTVTLMKAEVHQKQGKLALATSEMEQFLEMNHYQDAEMIRQVVQMHWFQRDFKKVQILIGNSKVCNALKTNTCDQYQAAMAVLQPGAGSYLKHFKLTTKAPKNAIALWSLAALEKTEKQAFQDRLVLLQRLSQNWDHLDPFLQIQFLDLMKNRVNLAVESVRKTSGGIAPLSQANEASLERRMRLIQDVDLTFAKVMKLNWMEVKIKTASELQTIYQQLAADLKAIGTPDQLLQPFVKKQNQIGEAVQQLLGMAFHPKENGVPDLIGEEIREKIPAIYWDEWVKAVKHDRPDYVYYLISLRAQDEFSPLLRGLVLTSMLKNAASTEGSEMIKSAPSTPWKETIASRVFP